ncbi:DUF6048 family protein [Paludibacter sp.]
MLRGQSVEKENNDSTAKVPIFNSFRVDIDISAILTSFINGGETFTYEAIVQTEIRNKYYPVFEIGYAGAKKTTSSGMSFDGNSLFYRLGMDFNIVKKKEQKSTNNNFFLVGARIGYTNFDYSLNSAQISGNYWNESTVLPELNKKSYNIWYEISAGIRVEMVKNIYLGWNVKIKNMITTVKPGEYKPWYVPGYGTYGDESVWGFNYLIGYKF